MIIKSPIVYDISHWKEVADFTKISPKPELIITKATEGISFVDDKFVRFFIGMSYAGIKRGCYHFHRKAYSPITQAQHFINTIRNNITSKDILVLDVEEGGESASQLMQFSQTVMGAFPNNIYMIYSRKNILDPIGMSTTEKAFFKNIPVWTAGYPLNPDLYNSPPAGYIPDQTKYGPVWLWQYSSSGIIEGIQGSVDLNWIHNDLYSKLGGTVEPPPDGGNVGETIHNNGVTEITGRKYDSDFRTLIIPHSSVASKTILYNQNECVYVESIGGFDFVANLTPFTQCRPNLGTRIDGVEYEPYHNYNPYLILDGTPVISHIYRNFRNYKTVSQGFRYIIENSLKNPNANDDWNIINPLRLVGTKANGDLVITMVKGRETGQRGWNLHEAAAHGLSLGCNMLVDFDGGGSVQEYLVKDGLKSLYIGVPLASRRADPVFLAIKFKTPIVTVTTPPPPGGEPPPYIYVELPDGQRAKYNKEA